jgi:hypothetical protein
LAAKSLIDKHRVRIDAMMPRSTRSPSSVLMQEARAIELLASEISVLPERLPGYWELSLELVGLVTDIEEIFGRVDQPDEDDAEILALRRRLRSIAARLAQMDEQESG